MSDLTEFKRLNFFTGFFTTAEDWNQGQGYHLEKRKLHNRGLHTPGIIRGEGGDLAVKATDPPSLSVVVQPGAALDGDGDLIYLGSPRTLPIEPPGDSARLVYITIEYADELSDPVTNVEAPHYSGDTRVAEIPRLRIVPTRPDNQTSLELARIDLQPGVVEITNPADPDNPRGNEINRCNVIWAGSVGVAEERLPSEDQERLILIAREGRRDFAALAGRFPVPSADDVRHAGVTVEMMARAGSLRSEQLAGVLATIADIEQDVAQEIGAAYPAVTAIAEYQAYQDAVTALWEALREGQGLDTLFNRQDQVAEAARELSEVVLQPPVADAGPDQTVTPSGESAVVTLDASGSQAFGGREIARYRWDHKQ